MASRTNGETIPPSDQPSPRGSYYPRRLSQAHWSCERISPRLRIAPNRPPYFLLPPNVSISESMIAAVIPKAMMIPQIWSVASNISPSIFPPFLLPPLASFGADLKMFGGWVKPSLRQSSPSKAVALPSRMRSREASSEL